MNDTSELAGALLIVAKHLPRHAASLTLAHNEHKDYYQTVAQYLDDDERSGRLITISADERQRAITSNELWELQWYPDSPVGFNCVAASTLEACLKAAAGQNPGSDSGATAKALSEQ